MAPIIAGTTKIITIKDLVKVKCNKIILKIMGNKRTLLHGIYFLLYTNSMQGTLIYHQNVLLFRVMMTKS